MNEFLGFYNYAQTFDDKIGTARYGKPKTSGVEYKFLGLFTGNILALLRANKGNADFIAMSYLTQNEQYLFWILWFCVTILCGLMFLKFLVAESRQSYRAVKARLDANIWKAKAELINECQMM